VASGRAERLLSAINQWWLLLWRSNTAWRLTAVVKNANERTYDEMREKDCEIVEASCGMLLGGACGPERKTTP